MRNAMIKAAIIIRAIVFFFVAALVLNIMYLTLVDPSMPATTPENEVPLRTIVFGAILLPAMAIALLDARGQLRKYFGTKDEPPK